MLKLATFKVGDFVGIRSHDTPERDSKSLPLRNVHHGTTAHRRRERPARGEPDAVVILSGATGCRPGPAPSRS